MTAFSPRAETWRATPPTSVSVEVIAPDSDRANEAERDLDARGTPIPFSSRPSVLRYLGHHEADLLVARDPDGACVAMIAVARIPTRAIPGHWVMRVEAVGDSLVRGAGVALLTEAHRIARTRARILRLVVEIECRHGDAGAELSSALLPLGFRRIPCEHVSDRTLVIELAPSEEAILAEFGRSTRQNIRAAAKHDLQLMALDDAAYGTRMNELLAGSFARTGGRSQYEDWAAVMRLSAVIPGRSRVVGAFRGSSRLPVDLVGFAWGLHHGDRVQYHTGASARVPGVRLPILYPVLWDLIMWGKRAGGSWFDLGGITPGVSGSDDALGGISDFKRGFSKVVIDSGQEWQYAPSPFLWRIAQQSSRVARWLRDRGGAP